MHNIYVSLYIHRLIRNPLGSTHPEATLKACLEHGAPEDAIQAAKAEFHSHLAANRSQQGASSHDLVEDAELMSEDREIDGDNQGKKLQNLCHFKELLILDFDSVSWGINRKRKCNITSKGKLRQM